MYLMASHTTVQRVQRNTLQRKWHRTCKLVMLPLCAAGRSPYSSYAGHKEASRGCRSGYKASVLMEAAGAKGRLHSFLVYTCTQIWLPGKSRGRS